MALMVGSAPCFASAEPRTVPAITIEATKALGDSYGPFASDGSEDATSGDVRIRYKHRKYAIEYRYGRSAYLTDNDGPGSRTVFPTFAGGTASVPFFSATETRQELRASFQVTKSFAAGVGYFRAETNYGYPDLSGIGVGIGGAGTRGRLSFDSSLFYYPNVSGRYRSFTLRYRVLSSDFEIGYRIVQPALVLVAGYRNEYREPFTLPYSFAQVRSSPYVGLRETFGQPDGM